MARRHELGAGDMAGVAFLLYWIAVIVFATTFKILARIGVPL